MHICAVLLNQKKNSLAKIKNLSKMASNSETGHSVNISNFKLMIDKCTAFGVTYNPSNTDLAVANMTTQWTTTDAAHQTLTAAMQNAKAPINARQILFDPVDKLVTKTLNYFESTKASKQIKKDAKGLADRYRGFGVKVNKLPDGTPDPNSVSTSHQSYVQKADTFKQLLDLYKSEPLYAPNETALTTATLTTLYNAMKAANDTIGTILAPVETARITRDNGLYAEDSGIVDVAAACKDYVQGLYGASGAETKLVRKIKFTRPK
jgi:hypothetical protein